MSRLRIEKIKVKTAEGEKIIIPKRINVLVGPNNSGKSRLLKELRDYLSGDHKDIKIISELKYHKESNYKEFKSTYEIESKMTQDAYGNWFMKAYSNKPSIPLDLNTPLENYYTRSINTFAGNWDEHYESVFTRNDPVEFFGLFGPLFFQYLGTEERLTICKTQHNYGMDGSNINYLSSVQYQSKLLSTLRDRVVRVFNKDIILDNYTLGDRLVFRVGESFNYIDSNSLTLEGEKGKRLFNEGKLDDQGDGLKSFVSTFLSLNLNNGDVLLIDEPEAFLHPPLARQLGEMIGEQKQFSTVFIATHSVEILKGILSATQDVNVIRMMQPIPFSNSLQLVDKTDLDSMLETPLLRVSRVLEGIFCEKVILTESEADELVYQELIEKLYPASGLYFAHGQNKQTLAQIAAFYKKIGIAYEIISDFDILRKPSELSPFLTLIGMSDKEHQRMLLHANKLREIVNNSIIIEGLSPEKVADSQKKARDTVYHQKGVSFFNDKTQEQLLCTLASLSESHLHILKTGELETLLEDYGLPYKNNKHEWVVAAIEKIANMKREDISPDSYLNKFLSKIKNN